MLVRTMQGLQGINPAVGYKCYLNKNPQDHSTFKVLKDKEKEHSLGIDREIIKAKELQRKSLK